MKIKLRTLNYEKIVDKIQENCVFEIDIKQFLQDTIKGNYKIKKKQFGVLVVNVLILAIPIEELISDAFPQAKLIFRLIETPFDELYAITNIIKVIEEEVTSYNKYIQSKKYIKTDEEDIEVEVEPELFFDVVKEATIAAMKSENLKHELVSNQMKRIYDTSEFIKYTDKTYVLAILNYLIANNNSNDFIKVNFKKIRLSSLFADYFSEDEARLVLQQEMNVYVESHDCKLDTYKLKNNLNVNELDQHLGINVIHNIISDHNRCRIVNITSTNNKLLDIYNITKMIDEVAKDEAIDNAVFIIEDMLIEFDKVANYLVQTISTDITKNNYIDALEIELNKYVSNYKVKFKKPELYQPINIFDTKDIDLTMKSSIKRLQLILNNDKVKVSHNAIKHIIPFYESDLKDRYIIEFTQRLQDTSYTQRFIEIQLDSLLSTEDYLQSISKEVAFDHCLFIDKIIGEFDYKHLIKITEKLFVIQIISTKEPYLKLKVCVNCGEGIFLECKLGKEIDVKLIDSQAKLGSTRELQTERVIKNELKKQYASISYLLNI